MAHAVCVGVVLCCAWAVVCMGADVEVVNGSSFGASGAVAVGSVERPVKGSAEYLQLFVEETRWYNDLVLGWWMPVSVREAIPNTLQTWLRNYVAGLLVYFISGGLWCLYIYSWKADHFFPTGQLGRGKLFLELGGWVSWISMFFLPGLALRVE